MDPPSASDATIRSGSRGLRDGCAFLAGSLRGQGYLAAGGRDAAHYGSPRCNRAPIATEVRARTQGYLNASRAADPTTRRFMSTPMGFRYLYDAGYIDREIDMWFHVCPRL
jgi:hypothetical protein